MTKNEHTDQYISIIPMDERLKSTESKASTLFKTIASKVAAETKRSTTVYTFCEEIHSHVSRSGAGMSRMSQGGVKKDVRVIEYYISFEEKQDKILKRSESTPSVQCGASLAVPFGVPKDRPKKGVFKTIASKVAAAPKKLSSKKDRKLYPSETNFDRRGSHVVGYSSACRRNIPGVKNDEENKEDVVWKYNLNKFPRDIPFQKMIDDAEKAFKIGVHPALIRQGSSGSYFIPDEFGDFIGVFKPQDEEPYGYANPKWGKYVQRKCCPCCFGRGCLIDNHGYVSEAGASIVDERLSLGVVPKTRCVMLSSKSFNNDKKHVRQAKKVAKEHGWTIDKSFLYPPKIGSYQTFVNDYKEAGHWLKEFEKSPLNPEAARRLKLLFERMVILDYVIRNTDRGYQNWLIRYSPEKPDRIYLAAIDNGLAFPFKHPNQVRGYPFSWTTAPQANFPFEIETKNQFLPILNDMTFVESLIEDLRHLFKIDKKFTNSAFEKQMEVMRGQIQNLCDAMVSGMTMAEMAELPRIVVHRRLKVTTDGAHFDVKRYAYSREKELTKPCCKRW